MRLTKVLEIWCDQDAPCEYKKCSPECSHACTVVDNNVTVDGKTGKKVIEFL